MNKNNVPIWEKVTITIDEAAALSNIGVNKLTELVKHPLCNFVLHVGPRKKLIKRREFVKYLEQNIEI